MMNNEIAIGTEIKINGRTYTVTADLGIGENTRRACPWIAAQYGIEGKRGAVAMMILFTNNTGRLVFTSSSKVEDFRELGIITSEVIGYTMPIEKLLASAN